MNNIHTVLYEGTTQILGCVNVEVGFVYVSWYKLDIDVIKNCRNEALDKFKRRYDTTLPV